MPKGLNKKLILILIIYDHEGIERLRYQFESFKSVKSNLFTIFLYNHYSQIILL